MNDDDLLRYSRHILLPELDYAGQLALTNSRIVVVGAGGLGCSAALFLASSGVGSLLIIDDDVIELSNLQRQIAFNEADIGQLKSLALMQRLAAINPNLHLEAITEKLDGSNVAALLSDCDVVLDCSDNFVTRFLLNKFTVEKKIPLVSGAAIRFEGQLSVFDSRKPSSSCYRCVYGESLLQQQQNCSQSGVFAPLVGVVGSMQALEALKLVANIGAPLLNRLGVYDALDGQWRYFTIKKDMACPVCSKI